jgi:hypothetical protein
MLMYGSDLVVELALKNTTDLNNIEFYADLPDFLGDSCVFFRDLYRLTADRDRIHILTDLPRCHDE